MRASKKSSSEQLNAFSSRMAALPGARSETRPRAPTHCPLSLLVPWDEPLPTGAVQGRRMSLVGRVEMGNKDVQVTLNTAKSKFLSPLGPLGLPHTFPSRWGEGTSAVLVVTARALWDRMCPCRAVARENHPGQPRCYLRA